MDYEESEVVDSSDPMGDGNDYIISPKVKEVAQEHFNCSTLSGAPLQGDASSSHWNALYLQSEINGPIIWNAQQYVSIFTFALMEDSGWYYVDYEYAKPFKWG